MRLTTALSLLALTSLLVACGGPEIARLRGDPKAAEALTVAPDREVPAAVDGVKRFLKAMDEGAIEVAWVHLSSDTRDALHKLATPVGKRGVDLLRALPAGTGEAEKGLYVADPVATFALRGAVEFNAGKPPYPPHRPVDGRTIEQEVLLRDAQGRAKTVTMRFEGQHWRIHAPKLGR